MKMAMSPMALLATVVGVASSAHAQTTYTVLTTGTPDNFSSDGSVILGHPNFSSLFTFAGGVKTPIGAWSGSGFADISGDGKIVAATIADGVGDTYAGYYTGGAWTIIPDTLGGKSGTSVTTAYGISDDGTTIVGLGWISASSSRAFAWTQAGGMVNLGSNGGSSRASGVNADGSVVVGFENHPQFGQRRPIRWVNGAINVDKPDDVGEYYSCSADGEACVGVLSLGGFIRHKDGTMQSVGKLTPGSNRCDLLDVSDDGRIAVGINQFTGGPVGSWTPVVWTKCTGLIDLEPFLISKGIVLGTMDLRAGWAITGDGTKILVGGNQGGQQTIIVETHDLICYADCDDSCSLSIDDFICFQTSFAIGDPYADCDGDGALSIDDFICFQTFFAIGC